MHLFLVLRCSVVQVYTGSAESASDEDEGCERHCISNLVECDVFFHVIIYMIPREC